MKIEGSEPEKCTMINLSVVIMPLVRLMAKHHEFSWSQREEIAWAIQECIKEHDLLIDEINRHKSMSEVGSPIHFTKKE